MGGEGYGSCEFGWRKDPVYSPVSDNGAINGPNRPPTARPRRDQRAEIETRTDMAMRVHSVNNGPINGPNLPQHRRNAATAHGVAQTPAKTPDPTCD